MMGGREREEPWATTSPRRSSAASSGARIATGSATASRCARCSPTRTSAPVLSPFLLLDYAGPAEFAPTTERRGVGEHPHRGFETVTIVYAGRGRAPRLVGRRRPDRPGDVQWMTAASGIVHEEFHGREFARRGGPFEMVQLWVNLPAQDKMAPPGYQAHRRARRSRRVALAGRRAAPCASSPASSRARRGRRRPSRRSTSGTCGSTATQRDRTSPVPDGYTTALVVLRGDAARERLRAPSAPPRSGSSIAPATSVRIDGAQRRDRAPARRRADRRADRRAGPVRDEHAARRSARRSSTTRAAGWGTWRSPAFEFRRWRADPSDGASRRPGSPRDGSGTR